MKNRGIVLGDVSGKGVSVALYMASLMSDIRHVSLIVPDPADRKLVIIDESLDIVEHSQAVLDGLNQTLVEIPHVMQEKHLEAVKAIKKTTAQLA